MYRGSVRGPLAAVGVAMSVVMLAACSPSASSTTTTVPAVPSTVPQVETTTTAVDTTTTVAETTTTQPATTTTTDAGEVVGDPEALRALYEEISDEVDLLYEDYEWELEMPDINVADPETALRNLIVWENQITVAPWRRWAEIITVPDSPARKQVEDDKMFLFVREWVLDASSTGEVSLSDIVELSEEDAESEVPVDVRDRIPDGSRVFAYNISGGDFAFLDRTTGEVAVADDGFEGRDVAVLVPTDLGWQMYWRE